MRIDVDIQLCLSSCLSNKPEENRCSSIDIDDTPIGSGGQGKIYNVTHIDGQRVSGLLVKSFDQRFPDNLRHIVSAVRDNKDAYKIEQCTALKALPLFLFTGTVNSRPFYGYVMRKIEGKPFSQIIEDDINSYINLPLEDRLNFCLQFVEGMDILYSLTIVHADINGQNLMIDTANRTLTIIDVDGGAVARTGTDPEVIGKLESWLAPEIMSQLVRTTRQQKIDVRISADLWSIACGVHYLLFGLGPFFFLASACPNDVKEYLSSYKWPELRQIKGIDLIMEEAFDYYEKNYGKVPELHRLLQASFQNDYLDPGRRIIASQWKHAIEQQLQVTTSTLPTTSVSTQTTTTAPPPPITRPNVWTWAALRLLSGPAAVARGIRGWRARWMAGLAVGFGVLMVFLFLLLYGAGLFNQTPRPTPIVTNSILLTKDKLPSTEPTQPIDVKKDEPLLTTPIPPTEKTQSQQNSESPKKETQPEAKKVAQKEVPPPITPPPLNEKTQPQHDRETPTQQVTQSEAKEVAKEDNLPPTEPTQPKKQKPRFNFKEGGQAPKPNFSFKEGGQ